MIYRTAAEIEKEISITRFKKFLHWIKTDGGPNILFVLLILIVILGPIYGIINKDKERDEKEKIYNEQQSQLVSKAQLWAGQWLERQNITYSVMYARPHKCADDKRRCAGFVIVLGATAQNKDLGHIILACQEDTHDCYILTN